MIKSCAQNFAAINCDVRIGFVSNNSNVPLFFSSATDFMVMAWTRKKMVQLMTVKEDSILACPIENTLDGDSQQTKPHIQKNNRYPV